MTPPRLPPRIEHPILRTACRLPRRLSRTLFGAPPTVEDQTLSAEMQAVLALNRLAGERNLTGGVSPAAARKRTRQGAAATAGPRLLLRSVTEVVLPGPAGRLAARFYEPDAGGIENRPLLVYFHGGGWVLGDLDTHDGLCRLLAERSGATVLSVDYRLAPEHPFPAAVEDALAAFRWAAENCDRLGVDPSRIAVGGDSAGANLAAVLSLLAREDGGPAPALQALIYPVTDAVGDAASRRTFAEGFFLTAGDMDWFEHHYLPPELDRADPRVSVMRAADLSGLPPACVVTAGFDPLRDEGERFAGRLAEAGTRVALRRHPGLIHGFANMTAVSPAARAAVLELCGAIRLGLA